MFGLSPEREGGLTLGTQNHATGVEQKGGPWHRGLGNERGKGTWRVEKKKKEKHLAQGRWVRPLINSAKKKNESRKSLNLEKDKTTNEENQPLALVEKKRCN